MGGTRSLAWTLQDVDHKARKADQKKRFEAKHPECDLPPFYEDLSNWALRGHSLQSKFQDKDYLRPISEDLRRQVTRENGKFRWIAVLHVARLLSQKLSGTACYSTLRTAKYLNQSVYDVLNGAFLMY